MWLPTAIVEDVTRVARIKYYNVADTKLWNEHRRPDELRMLTGWGWIAKDGSDARQGFKSMTVAYRDCWYALVQHASLPNFNPRPKLKLASRASKKSSSSSVASLREAVSKKAA